MTTTLNGAERHDNAAEHTVMPRLATTTLTLAKKAMGCHSERPDPARPSLLTAHCRGNRKAGRARFLSISLLNNVVARVPNVWGAHAVGSRYTLVSLISPTGCSMRALCLAARFGHANHTCFHREGLTTPPICLLYTSPSPRDRTRSRMPSSA